MILYAQTLCIWIHPLIIWKCRTRLTTLINRRLVNKKRFAYSGVFRRITGRNCNTFFLWKLEGSFFRGPVKILRNIERLNWRTTQIFYKQIFKRKMSIFMRLFRIGNKILNIFNICYWQWTQFVGHVTPPPPR